MKCKNRKDKKKIRPNGPEAAAMPWFERNISASVINSSKVWSEEAEVSVSNGSIDLMCGGGGVIITAAVLCEMQDFPVSQHLGRSCSTAWCFWPWCWQPPAWWEEGGGAHSPWARVARVPRDAGRPFTAPAVVNVTDGGLAVVSDSLSTPHNLLQCLSICSRAVTVGHGDARSEDPLCHTPLWGNHDWGATSRTAQPPQEEEEEAWLSFLHYKHWLCWYSRWRYQRCAPPPCIHNKTPSPQQLPLCGGER